ncbi:DUF4861 family protein [Limibacter armeniacum]|uniref:DUF4861 family protein n=1 Tax=Limibacter armeniacum TaxID=466084 RepID=UPI002FE63C0B
MTRYLNTIAALAIGTFVVAGCSSKAETDTSSRPNLEISLTNPLTSERTEVVEVTGFEANSPLAKHAVGIVKVDGKEVEYIDVDGDKQVDKLLVKATFKPEETIRLNLAKEKKVPNGVTGLKKTQAEISHKEGGEWNGRKYEGGEFKNVKSLRVPESHTDHSYYIRYEGPGWENEQIGYRFYLDWRNAIDIFGKKVDTLVLQNVGQDGFDSYHEPSGWGMDILKAGKSLGIGSIGQYINGSVAHFEQTDSVTCSITENNCLASSITTSYFGWETSAQKADLTSVLNIQSSDRAVKHVVTTNQALEGFCTGIVKHEKGDRIESLISSNGWVYLATYGEQSLAEDKLGLAIIFNTKDVQQVVDGEHDHLLVFKPTTAPITYYLLGAWEQEKNGITSREKFVSYLNERVNRLNNPIEVQLNFNGQ